MPIDPALEAQLADQYGGPLNVDPKTAALLQGGQFRPGGSIMPAGALQPGPGNAKPPIPAALPPANAPAPPPPAATGLPPAEAQAWNKALYQAPRGGLVDYAASGGSPPPPRLPAPPPPQMTKAGFIPHTKQTTVEQGVEFSPETKEHLKDVERLSADEEKQLRIANESQRQDERARAAIEARDLAAEIAVENVRKNKQESSRAWHWDKLMSTQRDLAAAEAKGIDPDRYRKSQGVGSQIATAIALIGGGLASGISGGPNHAMEFLKSQIANDIEAQRGAIAGKERAYEGQVGLYGMLRQHGMDEDAAVAGARLLRHQQLEKQLEAELTNAKDDQARLSLQKTLKDNAIEIAKLRGTFDEKASAKVQSSASEVYQPARLIGGVGGIPEKEQGNIFRDPTTGQEYKAGDEKSASKIKGALDLNGEVASLADKYQKAVNALTAVDKLSMKTIHVPLVGDVSPPPTAAAANARTLYFQLQGKFRQASDDGVWKKSESEMLSQQLQPPDQLLGSQTATQAETIKQSALANTRRVMDIERPEAVQTGYGRNAQGQVVPRAAYQGQTYQAPRDKPKTPQGFKEQ